MNSSNRIISADQVAGAVPFQLRDLGAAEGAGARGARRAGGVGKRGDSGDGNAKAGGASANAGVAAAAESDEAALARRVEQAFAKGFAKGQEQARGERASALELQRQQQLAQLSAGAEPLLQGMRSSLQQLEEDAAQRLIDLALLLARRLSLQQIAADPAFVRPVIDECLRLKADVEAPAMLLLHPDDCALFGAQLAATLHAHHVEAVPDPHIERGGCRLVGNHGDVDATLDTRWRELLRSLGRDPADWAQRDQAHGGDVDDAG